MSPLFDHFHLSECHFLAALPTLCRVYTRTTFHLSKSHFLLFSGNVWQSLRYVWTFDLVIKCKPCLKSLNRLLQMDQLQMQARPQVTVIPQLYNCFYVFVSSFRWAVFCVAWFYGNKVVDGSVEPLWRWNHQRMCFGCWCWLQLDSTWRHKSYAIPYHIYLGIITIRCWKYVTLMVVRCMIISKVWWYSITLGLTGWQYFIGLDSVQLNGWKCVEWLHQNVGSTWLHWAWLTGRPVLLVCFMITSSFCLRFIVFPWYCTQAEFCCKCGTCQTAALCNTNCAWYNIYGTWSFL